MPSFHRAALKPENVSGVIYFCRERSYTLEMSNKVVHALKFSSMDNQSGEHIIENSSQFMSIAKQNL